MLSRVVRQEAEARLTAERLIRLARQTEDAAELTRDQRLAIAKAMDQVALELTNAALRYRRFSSDPNFIPAYLRRGGPVYRRRK